MRKHHLAFVGMMLAGLNSPVVISSLQASDNYILLASTTSTENSGLFDAIIPEFTEAEAAFVSRGDDSGTNRAELRLWETAGVEPAGEWYRELGSGMGPTLNTAAAMDAYVMADRATWVAFENPQNLVLLFEGDEALFNQYGSLLIDPERHPHLKHDLAEQWHQWLLSDAGQQAIADFEVKGQQLFFPNAAD